MGKYFHFAWILAGVICIAFCGCSSEEPTPKPDNDRPLCLPSGYFLTGGPTDCKTNFDHDGGTIDRKIYGSTSEDFIAIYMISDKFSTLRDLWKPVGTYIAPGYDLENEGHLNDFPNSLDVSYQHRWAKFSIYKEPGSKEGILRITAEPYIAADSDPAYREMWVWLKNEELSCARIRQYKEGEGFELEW